jgi:dipeptidyl aminopeptidase/acylaminoacyl peptidase
MNTRSLAAAVFALSVALAPLAAQQPRGRGAGSHVYRAVVDAHWLGARRFWYRNDLRGGRKEFVVVDAERGARGPAFDHGKVAAALASALGAPVDAERLPFDSIEFVDDGAAFRCKIGDASWRCDLATFACSHADTGPAEPERADAGRRRGTPAAGPAATSPDGKWTAAIVDHNVVVRGGDGGEQRLSSDGSEGLDYQLTAWSPDSHTLAACRVEPGEHKDVYLVQSSPPDGGRARLQTRPYALPGDRFPRCELNLFDVATGKQSKPAVDRFEHEWLTPQLHWRLDGTHVAYPMTDRGHQRFRVVDVDVASGAVRNLVDETTSTFLWTAHTEAHGIEPITWLESGDQFVFASERSGWRHLYRVDAATGVTNAITSGEWLVRGIDAIDAANGCIWFRAGGVFKDQDPYFVHYGRVQLDGTGLVWLTDANGNHAAKYSPDRQYLIDTNSRVDSAPVTELRRTRDGTLVCRLETADIDELVATGWQPPEVFVAKGRDGTTDIWGVVCWPRQRDPAGHHAVIEDIYAGPQGAFVPKSFSGASRYESLNALGFVVVKIDGMGTANRSKAFHDVCWHDLADAGFADRILWMQALAKKYPEIDSTRVGVFGTSAGGQNAAGAVLFHPEFYKAAVANCGCHDNRMDKASWNEQWMGYPVGPQYAACSNIDNAGKLQGHLLLIVGELDTNVPPESTYRFVDALIKANKDFDFLVVPNGGHGAGGAYAARRRDDFFVRHLQGKEPPNRNAAK